MLPPRTPLRNERSSGMRPGCCTCRLRPAFEKKTERLRAPFHNSRSGCAGLSCGEIPAMLFRGCPLRCARLRGLARRAFRHGAVGAVAAHRGEMRKEAAGSDAGVVRYAFHNADEHITPAIELRDRAAAIAHARAGADRSAALGVDEATVFGVGDKARFLQARRVHALA